MFLACGSDSDGDDADAGPIDISGLTFSECEDDVRVGRFTAEVKEAFSATGGRVSSSVSPIGVLETISETGECRHARAAVTFCDPACTGGELCGLDGQCAPAPVGVDVGTVSVRGLQDSVEMTPVAPAFNYTNPGTLTHPAFAPGTAIALDASGGDFDAFTLLGVGVSPFELSTDKVMVESGVALAMSWTPMADPGPTRIKIELNVNLHGTAGSRIECLVEDTGSFTIPEPMITTLVADGLSGFPSVTFSRASSDRTTISAGCVDFKVMTESTAPVEIPGLESCSDNDDCTPPETCQPDLTCG